MVGESRASPPTANESSGKNNHRKETECWLRKENLSSCDLPFHFLCCIFLLFCSFFLKPCCLVHCSFHLALHFHIRCSITPLLRKGTKPLFWGQSLSFFSWGNAHQERDKARKTFWTVLLIHLELRAVHLNRSECHRPGEYVTNIARILADASYNYG